MSLEILKDSKGNDVVIIVNEDGSTLSMLKSTYDLQQETLANFVLSVEEETI